jgi:hypothetical protein
LRALELSRAQRYWAKEALKRLKKADLSAGSKIKGSQSLTDQDLTTGFIMVNYSSFVVGYL